MAMDSTTTAPVVLMLSPIQTKPVVLADATTAARL